MKKGTNLVVFLTVCIYVFLVTDTEGAKCFHFTWVNGNSNKGPNENCTKEKDTNNENNFYDDDNNQQFLYTPCIDPLCMNPKQPNLSKIWYDHEHNDNKMNNEINNECSRGENETKPYIKSLERHSVCVRYTYMYNGEVINISYFVGRVIEDQTKPVTSGCYVQYTEGYSVEACVCNNSDKNSAPCNSTIRNTYSSLIIFVAVATSLFMCKIFNIF